MKGNIGAAETFTGHFFIAGTSGFQIVLASRR